MTMKSGFRLTGTILLLAAAVFLTGCGSGSSSSSTPPVVAGLPKASPPVQLNSYFGTQNPGDIWKATLDHTTNSFTSVDLTINAAPTNGLFSAATDFLSLSQTNTNPPFQPAGFVLELPSRAAFLRPGFNFVPLVAMVPQTSCFTIGGNVTFQFIALPGSTWVSATDLAYGRFQASATGNNWTFSNLSQFTLAGSANNPGAALSAGVCGQSLAGNAVTVPPSSSIPTTLSFAVGPSGFFAADQGSGFPGEVGVIQPSTALGATNLAKANFRGFVFEPNVASVGLPVTQMAAFGASLSGCPVTPSASGICGGVFASDDPSAGQNNVDTTIELGAEDSGNNGLFSSATITIPDFTDTCNPGTGTCTLPAVAIAGNPEGKYALFLIAQDTVNNSPLTIYLLQQ